MTYNRLAAANGQTVAEKQTISVPMGKGDPMYNSPIELLVTDIQNQIVKQQDEEVYQAVLHYVPNVDKEELLRALKYDRDQYEKGYMDGKADAMASLVRCKDCKHWGGVTYGYVCSKWSAPLAGFKTCTKPDGFCADGERKDNDG